MYAIYTQPRPGRPRLALLTAAGVLLLTMLMAVGVIHLKRTGQSVPLGEPQLIPSGQLKCKLPAGWKVETPQQQGVIAEAVEPEGQSRRILMFRGLPQRTGVPSDMAALAVDQLLSAGRSLGDGVIRIAVADAARIGQLPAWDIVVVHGRTPIGMARAAVAPDGGVFGILLLSPRAGGGTRMLNEISVGMEFTDISTVDSKVAMDAAGIRFSAPGGTTFFRETTPRLARVRMLGGEGEETWYLDAYRVPLIGERTPAALVTDLALSTLQRPDLPQGRKVETNKLGEREYAEIALGYDEEKPPSILLACAQTAPGTGLMLVGRFESEAGDMLRRTCHTIAREAEVTPYSQLVDVGAGQANARQLLKALASQGLSQAWGPLRRTGREYLWQSPGFSFGHETQRYRPSQEKEGWWDVRSVTKLELGTVTVRELQDRWLVKEDGDGHQCGSQVTGRSTSIRYMEDRKPDAREVRRELNASGSIRKVTTPVDDTYACDPVLLEAAARLGAAGEANPAVFTATESFPQDAVHWIMQPAGELPVPGRRNETAPAVLLQRDYDPDPVVLYFRKGELLAISHDGTSWQTLAEDDEGIE